MKINDKEFLNPQQQLYQNTKDIEELKEKYKNEIYAVKPFSEWPEDAVLPEVEDPRDFTYVPRSITNVPANAKYGYLLINVENSFEPADSAALLYKIKSVNNSTVYIEFYANVASHVPGPQGEQGIQGPQGVQGIQGNPGIGIYVVAANLNPISGSYTTVNTSYIDTNRTIQVKDILIGTNDILGQITSISEGTCQVVSITNLKGEPGQATIGIQVVTTLPSTGTEGVIYLTPTSDPETGNAYDEYIYTNSAWEKFGYVDIDLSDYIQKSSTSGLVKNDGTIDTSSYATTSQLPTNIITNIYSTGVAVRDTTNQDDYYINGVEPNPTLAGTESDLTSIDIGGTAYKIPSGAVIDENIIPKTDNTYTLGDSSHLYNAGYIKKLTLLGNGNAFINAWVNGAQPYIQIRSKDSQSPYDQNTLTITPTSINFEKRLFPSGTVDIGDAYAEFNNLYLQGNIYTDENQTYGIILPDTTSWTSDKTLATAGTSAGDAPVLDANGKLSSSVLPAVAITDTFVVASEAAMLSLTAEVGDVAVRTDLNKSFILQTDGASTLSHWQELLTPTDSVTSVNGQTGAVSLTIPTKTSDLQNDSGYITSAPVTSVNGHTGSVTVTQSDLNIVYSATQPSNPVNGTIWIKPTN